MEKKFVSNGEHIKYVKLLFKNIKNNKNNKL